MSFRLQQGPKTTKATFLPPPPLGGMEKKSGLISEMVEQPEFGKNTPYLVDFLKITFNAKLLNVGEIRALYLEKGQSAAQIARQFGVAKSVILARLGNVGIRGGAGANRSTNPENYRCRVAPYGYSIQAGRLEPHKAELRICRLVVDLIRTQGLSANATGKELSRRGLKSRSGRPHWDHSAVLSIYKRWKDKL